MSNKLAIYELSISLDINGIKELVCKELFEGLPLINEMIEMNTSIIELVGKTINEYINSSSIYEKLPFTYQSTYQPYQNDFVHDFQKTASEFRDKSFFKQSHQNIYHNPPIRQKMFYTYDEIRKDVSMDVIPVMNSIVLYKNLHSALKSLQKSNFSFVKPKAANSFLNKKDEEFITSFVMHDFTFKLEKLDLNLNVNSSFENKEENTKPAAPKEGSEFLDSTTNIHYIRVCGKWIEKSKLNTQPVEGEIYYDIEQDFGMEFKNGEWREATNECRVISAHFALGKPSIIFQEVINQITLKYGYRWWETINIDFSIFPENPEEGFIYKQSPSNAVFEFKDGKWMFLEIQLPKININTFELKSIIDFKEGKNNENHLLNVKYMILCLEKIIHYRDSLRAHGNNYKFDSIDKVLLIPGIGVNKLNSIKKYITI